MAIGCEIARMVHDSGARLEVEIDLETRRGAAAQTRGFCHPVSVTGATADRKQHAAKEDDKQTQEKDNAFSQLFVNDRLTLHVCSPSSGYLTLLNIGTSGRPQFLVPAFPGEPAQFMVAGEKIRVNDAEWRIEGPLTSESGFPERFLAIITKAPVGFEMSDFSEKASDQWIGTRGGFASVEENRSRLWDLPKDSWGYGLIEIPVVE